MMNKKIMNLEKRNPKSLEIMKEKKKKKRIERPGIGKRENPGNEVL